VYGLTNEQYVDLIEKHFSVEDIEFTASEVYNYLVYENQAELKSPIISKLLIQIINTDITFLSIDPKRLSVMIMQSGNDNAVKEMLNRLFIRERAGVWNSYDTTIAIAYLIQSKFQHIDLLKVLHEHNENLYAYYYYGCKNSFICQVKGEKENRLLRCIESDNKAKFLYFMNLCEENRSNLLVSYAYYKSFFDRIPADMAFKTGRDIGCKKPNYKRYFKDKVLCALYQGIANSEMIIKKAHDLRNANPLSHSSADLIDDNSSSESLKEIHEKLDYLVDEYSKVNRL
jgi:AbiA family abortive infection protein